MDKKESLENNIVLEKIINNMNDRNKKAMEVMINKGINESVKHMLIDDITGKPLTYGEMRARYG